jgi:hypothetical protein
MNPDPNTLLLDLNGAAGAQRQFEVLQYVIGLQIDMAFNLFRVMGAGGVNAASMPGKHFIYVSSH